MYRSGTRSAQGYYSVISCVVPTHETVRQAAMRAAFEEVGVEVAEEDMILHTVMDALSPHGNKYFSPFFLATKWKGEIENKEPEKHDKVGFYPLNEPPGEILPYVAYALEGLDSGDVEMDCDSERSLVYYREYNGMTTLSS